ncbi:DoxX family protein [soil metagenome]
MEGFLGRYSEYLYALLRIVSGFLFMWHGVQKLLGYPPRPAAAGPAEGITTQMAIAGAIELIGGILIMVGLFTAIAAFLSSGLMAVAYFIAHFSTDAFLPIVNGGELAVLYCFVFLYIAARGSGMWSIDSMFRGPTRSEAG